METALRVLSNETYPKLVRNKSFDMLKLVYLRFIFPLIIFLRVQSIHACTVVSQNAPTHKSALLDHNFLLRSQVYSKERPGLPPDL